MKSSCRIGLLVVIAIFSIGCSTDDNTVPDQNCAIENYFSEHTSRSFDMGFTTWSFGPNLQDVTDTYQFVETNADIYAEHIDDRIPWNALINNLPLPIGFTNEINGRLSRKIGSNRFLLSVSLLNSDRSDLAEDIDGATPTYINVNDVEIENAYFKYIQYLTDAFSPDYLVISIEVNELRLKDQSKWEGL